MCCLWPEVAISNVHGLRDMERVYILLKLGYQRRSGLMLPDAKEHKRFCFVWRVFDRAAPTGSPVISALK